MIEVFMATQYNESPSIAPIMGGTAPLARSEKLLRQLQTVTEVSVAVSTNLDIQALLQTVADVTKERFDLYHTHVYLLDENSVSLNLAAGSGEPGRIMKESGHHIPLDRERSLVARAARTHEGVISNDVRQELDFLSNPLLPNTLSEIAIPMIAGSTVIGVLDMQSTDANRFDQDDVRVFTALAAQISIAVQNARQFERVRLYADTIDNMQNGFYVYRLEKLGDPLSLRMIATNRAASAMTGASMESVLGKTIGEAFPGLIETPIPQIYADIAANGGNWETENVVYSDDVIAGAFAVKAFALPNSTVGVTFENITVRKQNEATIAEANARTEILASFNAALTVATDEQEILAAFSLLVTNNDGFLGSLSYIDTDENNQPSSVEIQALIGPNQSPVSLSILPALRLKPSDYPILELVYQSPNQVWFIEDSELDPRYDENIRAYSAVINIRSSVLMPLYSATGWVGLAAFSWAQPQTFSPEVRELYNTALTTLLAVVSTRRQYLATLAAERRAENTNRRLQQVAEIATSIANIFDLDEMLLTAAEQIKTRFNHYHAHIYLLDENQSQLQLFAGAGEAGRIMKERGHMIPVARENSLVARAARTRIGVFTNDVSIEPDFFPNPLLPDTQAELAIPMIVADQLIGVLDVQDSKAFAFDDNDVFIQEVLAAQMAAQVQTLRQFEETARAREILARRATELETVAEVSRAVTTILDRDEMLQSAADLIKQRFNRYHAHIYLLDEMRGSLVLTAGADQIGRHMTARGHAIRLAHTNSLVARAARTQQSVISNDVTQEPDYLPNPLLPDTLSELAVPMIVGNTLIGVLDIQDADVNSFGQQDVFITSTLAAQIAVAVDNANKVGQSMQTERETSERLRQVDRLKSQFLANMSHELRTPLNSIIGYSEILLDGDDGELNEEANEDVKTIHQSGHHLLLLINDILDVAKIEAGEMRLDRRPVDLVTIASEVLHTAEVLVKDKQVTLVLEPIGDLLPVHADPVRMRQIMTNLVSNAIKFTDKGSVTLTIGLESSTQAYIAVMDTGMGVSEDDLDVIFEQFRQVDGSTTRRAGGTGLGLTITRYLVEMHGGSISVESALNVGSTFRFTIPVSDAVEA